SGHFATRAQAEAARGRLAKKFPGALVLHVKPKGSTTAVNNPNSVANNGPPSGSSGSTQAAAAHHLSGNAYEKASAKLPSSVGTGGKPAAADNKKAGGGTSGSCIGC